MQTPYDVDGRVLSTGDRVRFTPCDCGGRANCEIPSPSNVFRVSDIKPISELVPFPASIIVAMEFKLELDAPVVILEDVDKFALPRDLQKVNDGHEPAGSFEDVLASLKTPTKVH